MWGALLEWVVGAMCLSPVRCYVAPVAEALQKVAVVLKFAQF